MQVRRDAGVRWPAGGDVGKFAGRWRAKDPCGGMGLGRTSQNRKDAACLLTRLAQVCIHRSAQRRDDKPDSRTAVRRTGPRTGACYSAKRSPIPHLSRVQSFSMVFSVTFCWHDSRRLSVATDTPSLRANARWGMSPRSARSFLESLSARVCIPAGKDRTFLVTPVEHFAGKAAH